VPHHSGYEVWTKVGPRLPQACGQIWLYQALIFACALISFI
jgi:hypothetical protein